VSNHRKRASIALLFGALLLAPLPPGAGPGVAQALDVGEKAPDFTLPSTTGGTISLGQFRGKKLVLIEFYGADFSPT
jgi:hypothetical protein